MRTKFITFEGLEACGKSTQLERIRQKLIERKVVVTATREPGGTPVGEMVRHLLKHAPEGSGMCSEAELLLFCASRAELVRKVIIPALAKEEWVLSDRFVDSTLIYQGIGRGLPPKSVAWLNEFTVGSLAPGLTLILDLPVEDSAARLSKRCNPDGKTDRMEDETLQFFEKMRQGYLYLAKSEPARIRLVDARGSLDEVEQLIWEELINAFEL